MTCPEELTALLRARADREDAGDYCLCGENGDLYLIKNKAG